MKPEIFISYSSKDRDRVLPFVQRLQDAGASVWIDYGGIDGALLWGPEIVDAIEECKVMILMATQNSLASSNVIREITIASEDNKPILPLHLESLKIPKQMKWQLAGIQHIELFSGDDERNFQAIVRSLQADRVRAAKESEEAERREAERVFRERAAQEARRRAAEEEARRIAVEEAAREKEAERRAAAEGEQQIRQRAELEEKQRELRHYSETEREPDHIQAQRRSAKKREEAQRREAERKEAVGPLLFFLDKAGMGVFIVFYIGTFAAWNFLLEAIGVFKWQGTIGFAIGYILFFGSLFFGWVPGYFLLQITERRRNVKWLAVKFSAGVRQCRHCRGASVA